MRFSVILSIIISVSLTGTLLAQAVHINKKVIAEVNGEKIYASGIQTIVNDLQRSGTKITPQMRDTLIQRLIEQKLFAQNALKKGYDKKADVQHQMQVMKEMVLKDSYLSDLISKEVTKDTINQAFKKKMADYKPKHEYRAAHILLKTQEKAAEIYKELTEKKTEFSLLAKAHSTDSNAISGGDLGYFSLDMMVKPFSDTVIALKKNDFSKPVQTTFGWHIIKLIDKRALPKPTLEQLAPQIEAQLSRQAIVKHLDILKKDAAITLFDTSEKH